MLRNMKKQNVRTLALIVCAFTYLLVGAAIFDALESKNEAEERKFLDADEMKFKTDYNMTEDEFERLRRIMIKSKHYRGGVQWKFAGSFYFALTVFTTIGYGHSTPKTFGGKCFCIAYALGGIPLGLVMFQSIGERFNILITCIIAKLKKCVHARKLVVTQSELIAVACSLCMLVLSAGAAAFSYFEGWKFEDAFYYCFITLATIGFGDYVALQEDYALQKRPEYVAFSVLYILFGLTVFAAALNLLVLRLLTMNTEDERKDELEALATARSSVKLDGDIITAAATSVDGRHEGSSVGGAISDSECADKIEDFGDGEHSSLSDVRHSLCELGRGNNGKVPGSSSRGVRSCCCCCPFKPSLRGGKSTAAVKKPPARCGSFMPCGLPTSTSQTMHLLPMKGSSCHHNGTSVRTQDKDRGNSHVESQDYAMYASPASRSTGKRMSI